MQLLKITFFISYNGIGEGIFDIHDENTKLEITDDQEVYAQFEKMPYFLDLSTQGYGSTTGSGIYFYNEDVNISAEPQAGYRFTHWEWESNGSIFSEELTVTHTISGDLQLIAIFVPQNFTVSINSIGGGNISVLEANGSDANEFFLTLEYFLFLSPDEHYEFSGWSGNTEMLNEQNNLSKLLRSDGRFIPYRRVCRNVLSSEYTSLSRSLLHQPQFWLFW